MRQQPVAKAAAPTFSEIDVLTDEEKKARQREYQKTYREKNKEAAREYQKTYREKNKETQRAYSKAYKEKNPERCRAQQTAYMKVWYRNNREAVRAISARVVERMTPSYIAQVMGIPVSQLTPELLELKREQLSLYRLGKQIKAQLKEMT